MPSTSWRRRALPLLLATGLAAAASIAAQQPVPSTPVSPSYRPIGLYSLEIDGKPVADAAFFHSQASGSILVQSSQLSSIIELQPRGRVLLTHSADGFHRNRNGTLDRLPRAKPASTGSFELVDSLPRFELEGRRFAIKEKAALLGPQTADSLVKHDPTYAQRAQLYQPQAQYLDVLRQVTEPITVKVFLGTWCTVCSELMPHVLRVEEELEGSKVRFEYYGIARDFSDPEAKRLEVTQLPTGILYAGGKELHRIVGYSWRYPDMSLHNAILQLASPAGR